MAVGLFTNEQIFGLVRKMPTNEKREILLLLAGNETAKQQEFAEDQLRRLCGGRWLDWDALNADERENLIDDLIHEDRPCAQCGYG